MRIVLITMMLVSTSTTTFAEKVCFADTGQEQRSAYAFGDERQRPLLWDDMEEQEISSSLTLALSLEAPETPDVPHVLPCALAENGTFGKVCAEAQSYIVTDRGTQLCLFFVHIPMIELEAPQWVPPDNTDRHSSSISISLALWLAPGDLGQSAPCWTKRLAVFSGKSISPHPYSPSHWAPS